jgi:hypothetical protein
VGWQVDTPRQRGRTHQHLQQQRSAKLEKPTARGQ